MKHGKLIVFAWIVLAGLGWLTTMSAAQGAAGAPRAVAPGGPRALRGRAAIQALGFSLPQVAAKNGLSTARLQTLLAQDPDLWVGATGGLFYTCVGVDPNRLPAQPIPEEAPPFPLANTFLLHSLPGASKTIYLDFDGHVTSGTLWNVDTGGADIVSAPYDTDGNPGSFSAAEQEVVQRTWERVAEDYAPFDVDVTTEDPGPEALRRTSAGDTQYGVRMVVSPTSYFYPGAGGVAYVGVFDRISTAPPLPGFVFSSNLADNERYIAEAASHEAGHTLGLNHDGTGGANPQGYYAGQGDWAPIMGVGYYVNVTQFSRGEYANANNFEDDLAVMQTHGISYRADDYGNSIGSATLMTDTISGRIETAADVDFFRVNAAGGTLQINAAPAPLGPNLDVRLTLYNSAGVSLATADPTGLPSTLTQSVAAGTYYVSVEGVGAGDPVTDGYSDYASLGEYTLTGSGIAPPFSISGTILTGGGQPIAGATVTVSPGGKSAVTAANGTYTVVGFDSGPYTVTPTKAEFDFLPISTNVNVGPDVTGVNFTGTQRTYALSGTVTFGGNGLGGVLVTVASGPSTMTAANGTYSFSGLVAGTYTVVPTKAEFDFSPANRSVTLGPNKTGVDFTASVHTYTISGTLSNVTTGQGAAGVTVSAGAQSTISAANGTYTISGLPAGTYTVTPADPEYDFLPLNASVTVGPNKTGVNFTGTQHTYTISGTVRLAGSPLAGVLVSAGGQTATTAADGTYTVADVVAGTYAVVASKPAFAFSPTNPQVTVGPSRTGIDFTAQPTYTVTGTILLAGNPLAGVTVSAGGHTGTTAANGTYTVSDLIAGTYTVTPAKAAFVFNPQATSVTVGPDKAGVDFMAVPAYSASGTVTFSGSPLAGVLVSAGTQFGVTGADGTYTIDGLVAGAYTAIPAKKGYAFTPVSRPVSVPANQTGIDFTAVAAFDISGTITAGGSPLAGVAVTAGTKSATSAADGTYTISGLVQGTYNVTPAKAGYIFNVTSTSVTVGPDKTGIDFSGTRVFNISGTITEGAPLAGVNLTAGNISTISAADGTYTLSGLVAGTYTVSPSKVSYSFAPLTQAVTVGPDQSGIDFAGTHLFTISGFVTLQGQGIQGVTVAAGNQTTQTQANGKYILAGLPAGTYTVTPTKSLVTFAPLSASVTVGPDATGIDFSATQLYTVSGTITTAASAPIAGVTVSAGGQTATTAADGTYTVLNLPVGTYTVTPTKAEYTFSPASRSVTVAPNQTGVNFTGTQKTYTLRGTILSGGLGVAGVTVSAGALSATTAQDGTYTLTGLPAGSYTVTPSLAERTFTPASLPATVGPSQVGFDFVATVNTYTLAGTITSGGSGLAGVTVTAGNKTATTAGDGTYSVTGLVAGTYTATPALSGYVFTPGSRSVTLGPNRANVDFTATPVFTISGTVSVDGIGLAGVSVTTGSATATTAANGTYVLSGVAAGTYTVTPTLANYQFAPSSQPVTVGPSQTGINFAATPLYTISGTVAVNNIGLAGVTVTAAGTGSASAITAANGTYSLTGLVAGTYTISPALATYSFTPATTSVTVGPSKSGVNFAAAHAYKLRGTVRENGVGLAGVTVSTDGASAVTGADGTYELTGVSAGGHTLTATRAAYRFQPATLAVNANADLTGLDFAATHLFSINGRITNGASGLAGVVVTAGAATATTAADGTYTISGLAAGPYTVIPAKDRYAFDPTSRAVMVGPDQTGVDFSATPLFSIQGRVNLGAAGVVGVTITAGARTATTGSDGSYALSGLAPGQYEVTPQKADYMFSPATSTITVGPDAFSVNFQASVVYSLGGKVTVGAAGLGGVTVKAGAATTTTAADGTYLFPALPGGSYTVVPTKAGYVFTPANKVVALTSSQTAINFAATAIALKTLTVKPNPVASKKQVTGGVELTSAVPAAVTVALTSSNPALAPVPATASVPAGSTKGAFKFKAAKVTRLTSVTITASYGGVSKSVILKIKP